MTLSYLISTAGHAQAQNESNPHNIRSINQLIHDGAEELGDKPVVGFAVPVKEGGRDGEEWDCERYSFRDLAHLAQRMAETLKPQFESVPPIAKQRIVSLLCPTNIDFLVAWIACMGLEIGVVFIAPQCSPSAITSLLQSTTSTHLLYHPHYTSLAQSASLSNPSIPIVPLPALHQLPQIPYNSSLPNPNIDPSLVSHVFHTSGTSGTPKPIVQTHLNWTEPIPRRELGEEDTLEAAFTTTPLFHGGVSDLLRAWMARSSLYLYPSSTSSITASSIVKAFTAGQSPQSASTSNSPETLPPITAFLSVPYILTLLSPSADPDDKVGATALLAGMKLVSTGGAPLDREVGDGLVGRGVKLVSRLGSSECGFLLSSYRDFETDKEWEWLHNDSPYADALVFESFEEDPRKAEMVVTNGWKSKLKSNRADGSYATGDLYERHPTKSNVWRYAGRGDDVLVLSNGEKMSPAPIESILSTSPLLTSALIVGSNRPQIGCLLFPASFPPPGDLVTQLKDLIEKANEISPSHAQLGEEMCFVIEGEERAGKLPKSSKGTIQRGVAYEVYEAEIEKLYGQGGNEDGAHKLVLDERELEEYLMGKVDDILGNTKRYKDEELERDTDLFSWGVDSVKAARLRFAMLRDLDLDGKTLPLNVVFEYSTIARLAQLCVSLRRGGDIAEKSSDSEHEQMRALVEKYGSFSATDVDSAVYENGVASGKEVVLTGATGSLGSHILHHLASLPHEVISHIICLVRGEDEAAATERVRKALSYRQLGCDASRYTVVTARLGKERLGLPEEAYLDIANRADIVIHAAWAVHFGSGLSSFETDHINGTRNLLDLALQSRHKARFLFCSSLASVLGGVAPTDTISETLSTDPATAIPIGYSQSKWVTENICARATQLEGVGSRVQVLRIGQLCGDMEYGRWNEQEGWPLLLRTAGTTGKLPDLREDPSWLPVDVAAASVCDVALAPSTPTDSLPIYHVANPLPTPWTSILSGLKHSGLSFTTVSADEWVKAIEVSPGDEDADPSKKMLGMWKKAYGDPKTGNLPAATVSCEKALDISPALRNCGEVDEKLIGKMVDRWRESGFIQK